MEKLIINGKEIKTNINGNKNGDFPKLPDSMNAMRVPSGMTFEQFLNERVKEGYTTITFYYTSTTIRGWHNYYAKCRR